MEIIAPFLVIIIGLGTAIVSSINWIRRRWHRSEGNFGGSFVEVGGDFGSGGGCGGCGGGCGG